MTNTAMLNRMDRHVSTSRQLAELQEFAKIPANRRRLVKWVATLRSGNYVQGKHALCRSNLAGTESVYCCLGVYYDLFGDEWIQGDRDNGRLTWKTSFHTQGTLLSRNFTYSIPHDSVFAEFNDALGATFGDIADWVETRLLNQ